MKKLITAILLSLVFVSSAWAIEWFAANQVTVAWDQVTTLADGSPIPAGDVITYRIHYKMVSDGVDVTVGDTDQLEYLVTFAQEADYIVGVQALRLPQGQTELIISPITWSDSEEPGATANGAFGIKYFLAPGSVGGIRMFSK